MVALHVAFNHAYITTSTHLSLASTGSIGTALPQMCAQMYPQAKVKAAIVTYQIWPSTAYAFLDTPTGWRHCWFIWQRQSPRVVVARMFCNAVGLEEAFNNFSILYVPEFTDERLNSVVESQLVLQGARTHREQPQVFVTQLAADRWRVHQSPEPVAGPLPWAPGCIPRLHVLCAFD